MKNVLFVHPADAFVESAAQVLAIVHGEIGYRELYTPANLDVLNGGAVAASVIESAIAASMFGWHTKIAKEANDFFFSRNGTVELRGAA